MARHNYFFLATTKRNSEPACGGRGKTKKRHRDGLGRYKLAFSLLNSLPSDVAKETMQRAARSNGSINVSMMLNMATMLYVMNLPTEEKTAPDTVATPETT